MAPIISDVAVIAVPAHRVLSVRAKIDSFPEQGAVWKSLEAFVAEHQFHGVAPGFAIHHNLGAAVGGEGRIDVEACIPVDEQASLPEDHGVEGLTLRQVPALARAATVSLHGTCLAQGDMYTALFAWLMANDERQAGPTREVYLTRDVDPLGDDYRCQVLLPLA